MPKFWKNPIKWFGNKINKYRKINKINSKTWDTNGFSTEKGFRPIWKKEVTYDPKGKGKTVNFKQVGVKSKLLERTLNPQYQKYAIAARAITSTGANTAYLAQGALENARANRDRAKADQIKAEALKELYSKAKFLEVDQPKVKIKPKNDKSDLSDPYIEPANGKDSNNLNGQMTHFGRDN